MVIDLVMAWSHVLFPALSIALITAALFFVVKYYRQIARNLFAKRIKISRCNIEQNVLMIQAYAIEVEALVLSYLEKRQSDPVRYLDSTFFMRDEEKNAVIDDLRRSRDILYYADRLLSLELMETNISDNELIKLADIVDQNLHDIIDIRGRIKILLQT